MKATRILLFLSPLIVFLPPLLPASNQGVAWGLIALLFRRILRLFPWNLLMAGLCYSYAKQLSRDEWRWGMGAFALPFLTPLLLAFMPPRPGSTAAEFRSAKLASVPAKAATGSFGERFPLLERCLSSQPEDVRSEQRARFAPVAANFEFALTVPPDALHQILGEAQLRQFVVWVSSGQNGAQVFGAGLVGSERLEETAAWLCRARATGSKVDVAARAADGRLRLFEYRSA